MTLGFVMLNLFHTWGCTSNRPDRSPVYHAGSPEESPRSLTTVLDDSLTLAKIKKKISDDELVDQDDIHISVRHGVVHLTGTARDIYHRQMMESLIRTVEGVNRIENRMRLAHRATAFETPESIIVNHIRTALMRDPDLGSQTVTVKATPTRVVISGQTRSEAQKQRAAAIARSFAGNRQVVNAIQTP